MRSDPVTSPADAGFGRDIINEILVGLDSRVQETNIVPIVHVYMCVLYISMTALRPQGALRRRAGERKLVSTLQTEMFPAAH